MQSDQNHPDADQLRDFVLGKLPVQAASQVEQHISECETCCDLMEELDTDGFVDQLCLASASGNIPLSDDEGIPTHLLEHTRYEVEALIGRGGMGRVYKARHRMMDRSVALKVIHHNWVRNSQAIDRFHREVKTVASISHANIVAAYDAEQVGDLHLLVMEYVDGVDLAQAVNDEGKLPIAKACDYIRQSAVGLQHAHDLGLVHRDIKPHNLIVTNDNVVKILDFGLASLVSHTGAAESVSEDSDGSLTMAGAVMGTPDFISPEQAQDARNADGRSDIYSLGMTLYFLLTGQKPFADSTASEKLDRHIHAEPVSLKELRADVPDALADILNRMIAKDPSDRFQAPSEVAEALGRFCTPASFTAGRPWIDLRKVVLVGLAAFLLVGAIYVTQTQSKKMQSQVANSTVANANGNAIAKTLPAEPIAHHYDFSLVPSTAVEVLGMQPSRIHEYPKYLDAWQLAKDTPLGQYFDRSISQAMYVRLPSDTGQSISIAKFTSGSAKDYLEKRFPSDRGSVFQQGGLTLYQTVDPELAYRLIGDDTVIIGSPEALVAHHEQLGQPSESFESVCELLQSKSALGFKVSTPMSMLGLRSRTNSNGSSMILDFTLHKLDEISDYMIAAISMDDVGPKGHLINWCSESEKQEIATEVLKTLPSMYRAWLRNLPENARPANHAVMMDALGKAKPTTSQNSTELTIPFDDPQLIRDAFAFYLAVSRADPIQQSD